ncbi:4'-phosphopantetheinyl transferase superfamily protein [Pseudoalteromonas sp. MMG010]|uniref:4'-phosphopantetheinyl transferase family protein n=1 Tax=Pseudoalteromonas sp. MMG010 TaxID=2822685 RepID=UPI001B3A253E|nr:4'-phosphopantetheinyl transferase superfamily protein [Pseudoalteromonas sp. MMG010]MBQ4833207.1 4'-phosphopantetheinyl transferase superfamily protein [Pseudoalteromonas sp. MMG010]
MTALHFNNTLKHTPLNDKTLLTPRSIVFFNAHHIALADYELNKVLSPFELNTIERRKSPSAKQEYLASRLLLKFLVKHALPEYKQLKLNAISSEFDDTSAKLQLHINNERIINSCISHSHAMVGAALNLQQSEFGFDIEKISTKRPFEKLAKHFYHLDEINMICDAKNEAIKADRFFRIWTLKEALAKATSRPVAKLLSPNVFTELALAKLNAKSMQFNGFDISAVHKKNTDWRCFSMSQRQLTFE